MITNKQKEYLRELRDGEVLPEDNPKKYSATMIRIQEQIDKNISNLIWLIQNFPELLKDEGSEFDNDKLERYRRFKAFAYIVSQLNPLSEIEEVELTSILKKLSKLYPKFYFEIIRKKENVS